MPQGGGGALSILATEKEFTVNILSSDFKHNTATGGNGGAVAAFSGKAATGQSLTLNVRGCSFDQNKAVNASGVTSAYIMGGGLYLGDLFTLYTGETAPTDFTKTESITGSAPCKITATVDNCRFTSNEASQGGGIDAANLIMDASQIQLTVKNSLFEKNKALPLAQSFFGGGGLCARLLRKDAVMSVDIDGCIFKDNQALLGGGATILTDILVNGIEGDAKRLASRITNTVFDTNTTTTNSVSNIDSLPRGGGLYVWACAGPVSSDVINCVFTTNKAAAIGGGIGQRSDYGNELKSNVENCTFIDNQTTGTTMDGGAIANLSAAYHNDGSDKSTLNQTITNCTFTGNQATGNGGAISNTAGSLESAQEGKSSTITQTITNCTFVENKVGEGKSGADIYSDSSKADGTVTSTLYNTIVTATNVTEKTGDNDAKAVDETTLTNNKNAYFADGTTHDSSDGPEVVTGVVVKTGDTTTFEATTYKHTVFALTKDDTTLIRGGAPTADGGPDRPGNGHLRCVAQLDCPEYRCGGVLP